MSRKKPAFGTQFIDHNSGGIIGQAKHLDNMKDSSMAPPRVSGKKFKPGIPRMARWDS